MKIYKASIESLIAEATAGGEQRPVVYIQTLQRHKNGQAGENGAIVLTSVEVVVSGWNQEVGRSNGAVAWVRGPTCSRKRCGTFSRRQSA